jgi:hypothetical protein
VQRILLQRHIYLAILIPRIITAITRNLIPYLLHHERLQYDQVKR